MSELKWVCNAKGGWAPLPPLKSQRNYATLKVGRGVRHVSKLTKKRFNQFYFIPAKQYSASLMGQMCFC